MEIRSRLLVFLDAYACSEQVDEAVLEYACGILASTVEDADGDEQDNLQHLDSLLEGACGERYQAIGEGERQRQLLAMVQEARRESATAKAVAGTRVSSKLVQPAKRVTTRPCADSAAGAGDKPENTARDRENVSPTGDLAGARASTAVVRELLALCSEAVSEDFLRYALTRRFQGSAEALASWLLDSDKGELQAAEAEWESLRAREAQQEEEARLLKERNKQQILQKFDLQPVPLVKDPKKAGKAKGEPITEVWPGKQAQQAHPKVRYLDGRVVSTKGEKFIVEKTGEEWDGGSRGKVYTKGKRGKGFA